MRPASDKSCARLADGETVRMPCRSPDPIASHPLTEVAEYGSADDELVVGKLLEMVGVSWNLDAGRDTC